MGKRNAEKRRAYLKKYHSEHKERANARSRAWHEVHREEQNIRRKALYARTAAQQRAAAVAFRIAHWGEIEAEKKQREEASKEKARMRTKAWVKENPERKRMMDAWYYAQNYEECLARVKAWSKTIHGRLSQKATILRRRSKGHASAETLKRVFATGKICVYCGKPGQTIDHFIPLKRGGTNDFENLVIACSGCNASKQASEPFAWMMRRGVRFDVRAGTYER